MRTHWLKTAILLTMAGCPTERGPFRTGSNDPCATQDDCRDGEACVDLDPLSANDPSTLACVAATCMSDDDCDDACIDVAWNDGCGLLGQRRCTLPQDQCASDFDCSDGQSCAPDSEADNALRCWHTETCAVGRPLSVDHELRTAPIVRRADWSTRFASRSAPAAVIDHWRGIAAMEHASIGSFARFSLELLAMGAPPELLIQTQQAASDEIEHARLVFGWIGALGGGEQGPGALQVHDVRPATSRQAIFARLIEEGCVGETVGAALVEADAEAAEDPELHAMLLRIAEDETRHAALAWRTAAWMCEQDPSLVAGLVHAIDAAANRLVSDLVRPDGYTAHGIISNAETRALVTSTLVEVVHPLMMDLLERSHRATPLREGAA